jgi:hypothetical protein
MALKDLIASTSALTEEAIENLIKDYARYDVEDKQVAFLPAASKLSGRQKVLVYLVALQGWPILAKGQEIPTAAKPAHLGERVGIHGGTLRPLLKDLKDRHLIATKGGAYSVRAASLSDIKAELEGRAPARRPPKPTRSGTAKGTHAKAPPKDALTKATPAGSKPKRKTAVGKAGELTEKFNGWITDGFFDTPRTLSEVQGRFHEQGDIVPRTTIPSYLLAAVRARPARLVRKKADVGGKDVWVYTKPV